jgi:hypothetical protein
MASLQGCHLLCCPNCGYQMVDESESFIVKLLRRTLKTPDRTQKPSKGGPA